MRVKEAAETIKLKQQLEQAQKYIVLLEEKLQKYEKAFKPSNFKMEEPGQRICDWI